MKLRAFQKEDISEIKRIYESFYDDNEYPNFETGYYDVFVITDDNNKIISIGGVKPIMEIVALTNRDKSVRDRKDALIQIMNTAVYTAVKFGFNQLHAFVHDDPEWIEHLKKVQFKESENKVLILSL
jgi:hypothetical protein